MKALLLYRGHAFDPQQKLPPNGAALTQDLELDILFAAMAADDKYLFDIARTIVLTSLTEPGAITYRQDILRDCLENAPIVRDLYATSVETMEKEKKNYWSLLSNYPSGILHRSVEVMQMFMEQLKKLRAIASEHQGKFASEGFKTLFVMLQRKLEDDYFESIQQHLRELRFRDGVLISAGLGKGVKGIDFTLSRPKDTDRRWWKRLFAKRPTSYRYVLAGNDEAGARALSELQDQGINLAANALAQSNEHILSFFASLRAELAFYVGCLNLNDALAGKCAPT